MRYLLMLVAACHAANAGDLIAVQPALVQYDVPQRQVLYSAPAVVHGQTHLNTPYIGTYAVQTSPAVHHNYHHTQTHPVGYGVRPVHVLGGTGVYGSGQYYQPAATSSIHQSRVIVPTTNRVYQYQPYVDSQSGYSSNAYDNYGNGGQPQQFNGNDGYDSNAVNGGQVKTRRYQIRRPALRKEYYDIEEKVVIRPAGSTIIALDSSNDRQDSYAPAYNGQNQYYAGQSYDSHRSNPHQYSGEQGNTPNQIVYTRNPNPSQNPTYFIPVQPNPNPNPRGINCDHPIQIPVHPPPPPPPAYYPRPPPPQNRPSTPLPPGHFITVTTLTPQPTYASTTLPPTPSRTYQPPYNDQDGNQYQSTTYAPLAEASTPRQTVVDSTTPSNQDVFVSSTTPIAVTIVETADTNDKKNDTQRQDIVYVRANEYASNDEDGPDQFRNELPPRGDIAQTADYRETDQFYHELPRSRYTGPHQPPAVHVETKSNGEPTEVNYYAEEITIGNRPLNGTRNRNTTERLIAVYAVSESDGAVEIGQNTDQRQQQQRQQPYHPQRQSERYTNDRDGAATAAYTDGGNVRARVIASTPAPEGALPSEHTNRRRIVVTKPVETVHEVVVAENDTNATANNNGANNWNGNGQQSANYNANYNDDNSNYNSNYNNNNNYNDNSNSNNNNGRFTASPNYNYDDSRASANYANDAEYNSNNNNNNNYNRDNFANGRGGDSSSTSSRYSSSSSSSSGGASSQPTNGYYISTTPASTGKRVIYVKPVTQEFADQRAVAPSAHSGQQRRL